MSGSYCSRACSPGRPRIAGNYVTKTCPGCGDEFTCSIHKETEHCSRKCRGLATLVEAQCPMCGEDFAYYASWPRVHCSSKCYGRSRDKGGRHYYGPNWQVQRAFAIVRDGGACVDCGATDPLHVHHIRALREFDGDWQTANQLDNLVTVCPTHHVERHGGHY